jgi:hypothetical protein
MGSNQRRTLDSEQTQNVLRATEVDPAANDFAIGRPADLGRAEGNFDAVRGIAMCVLIGGILWVMIGALLWLCLR